MYDNVSDYLNRNSLEASSEEFGVSKPTISRWISKQEFPASAEVVVILLNRLEESKNQSHKYRYQFIELEEKINIFTVAFNALVQYDSE